jgi:hypothetical protein
MYKIHHPKTNIGRLYIKRSEGGRGFLEIEATYQVEINNTAEHPKTKYEENEFANTAKSHENNQLYVNSTKNNNDLCIRIKEIKLEAWHKRARHKM